MILEGAYLLEVNAYPDFAQTGDDKRGLVQGLFQGVVQGIVKPFVACMAAKEAWHGQEDRQALEGHSFDLVFDWHQAKLE